MRNLSATVITFNEEKNIARCLNSLKFVDEVIVVDSFSSDSTKKICSKYKNVIFYENKWKGYTDQKNFAAKKASNDWILNIDADEVINEELSVSLLSINFLNKSVNAYVMYETDYMYGKLVRGSGYCRYPRHRLYNRKFCKFNGTVHEKINIDKKCLGEIKKGEILHYSHNKISDTISGYNTYTELEAKEIYKKYSKGKGMLPLIFELIFEVNKQFFGRLIVKRGYLDGVHGLIIAIVRSFYPILSFLKFLEIRYNHESLIED